MSETKLCNFCKKTRKEFCVCGDCNHCHIGGWNINKEYSLHWYQSQKVGGVPTLVKIGESHGGHCWIPDYQFCACANDECE
jgi:hypothetical protein